MQIDLTGKVAVVTGASRGIGASIAKTLGAAGASIAAVATEESRAAATAQLCRESGTEAEAFGCDVSDGSSVQRMADAVLERFGTVHILVNNAGVTKDGVFLRMGEADWDRVLDVNLKGAYLVTKAFSRVLLKNRGARVINMASVVGMAGNAGQANYAASKGGLIALTRSLAKEFGSRGVTVNAIAPGYIETDMTEGIPEAHRDGMVSSTALGRPGRPVDVAGAALFLASELGDYVTGQVLVVDGGMRL